MGNLLYSSPLPWQATSRNIVITGASNGVGAEIARMFAKEGARLALFGRDSERLEKVAAECLVLGAEVAKTYQADLTLNRDIERSVSQSIEDFGQFDVVVLNAGKSQGCYFEEVQDMDQIDHMIQLNVGGVIKPLQKLLPCIHKSRHSRIVFVSSTAGVVPVPYRSIYCASKFAVSGFAGTIRMELKEVYGEESPKVCLLTFPEVSGTALNESRMTFGAVEPPVQFRADQAMKLETCVKHIMDVIRSGERTWGTPLKVRIMKLLMDVVPGIFERMVLSHLRKTHFRPKVESQKI